MQIESEIVSALSGFLVWSVSLTDRSKCIMQTREVMKGVRPPHPIFETPKTSVSLTNALSKIASVVFDSAQGDLRA